ncbi:protein kinase [Myxococcota bacterium]|nr:protein kinase [Myxococcota bacterium]
MILCPQCQTINEVASTRCAGCGASLDGDAAALGSDPYIGRQLGDRFFLQSFLGSGEIGLVYRGTDVSTNAEVAVKIVHPDVAANIGDRLLRSAVAISQVRHAKLASVLAAAREPDGTLYVATEYLRGHTLKQMLEHNGPLGPRRAADILFQLASALAPIHKVGRPHANLKPENVFLVERDGSADFVRVCDVGVPDLFGVRKSAQGAVIIGSPKYFSPEQAQGQAATVLSDQFTLGIIAYQLLTGALPFFGATPDQLLAAIAAGTPTPIARRTPGIQLPPKLEQIIQRCLSKTPGERYADLRALATDVAAVIKSTQPEAAPPRKKGFVQASTVMADPGQIGSLQASVEVDDDDDGDDRTSVREVHWGSEKTGEHTPLVDDRTPAVSAVAALAATTRPSPPAPPPAGRPPRPPTQNDMMNVPPPLMVTGAIDSSDLQAALESATAAVGRPAAAPQAPPATTRRPAFDDDLQAALAAAAAEVGDGAAAPPARRPATPDPFGGVDLAGLNATPAGSAAALASAPSARPSSPGGVRLTHEIMSAIDEELVDASVSIPPQAGAPAAPLATMDDLKELKRPVEGAAANRPVVRPGAGNSKAKLAAAGLLLVLGGGAGAYFLMGETPTPPAPRVAPPATQSPAAVSGGPSAAPSAGPSGASSAAPSVAPSAPATASAAASVPPSAAASAVDPDEPALVRKAREDAEKAAAAAAASGAPAPLPTSVSLTSEPAGATVLIGDRKLGLTPMDVPIDPATPPVFTLRLDGYESAQFAADPKTATPGKPFTIATKLVAAGAAPAPATAAATAAPRPKPKPAPSEGSAAPAPKPKPKPAPKKPSAEVEDPFAE